MNPTTRPSQNAALQYINEVKKQNSIINSNNLNSFYKSANGQLSNRRGVGTLLDNAGNTHCNDLDKANLLNNYFISVFTLDDCLTPEVALLVSQSEGIGNI